MVKKGDTMETFDTLIGRMTVRRKLTLMSFGISVVVVLLSSGAFLFFLVALLEKSMAEDVQAVVDNYSHPLRCPLLMRQQECPGRHA